MQMQKPTLEDIQRAYEETSDPLWMPEASRKFWEKYSKSPGTARDVEYGGWPAPEMDPLDYSAFAPGVGDVTGPIADVRMMFRDPEQITPMNVGLAGLGFLPGIPSGLGNVPLGPSAMGILKHVPDPRKTTTWHGTQSQDTGEVTNPKDIINNPLGFGGGTGESSEVGRPGTSLSKDVGTSLKGFTRNPENLAPEEIERLNRVAKEYDARLSGGFDEGDLQGELNDIFRLMNKPDVTVEQMKELEAKAVVIGKYLQHGPDMDWNFHGPSLESQGGVGKVNELLVGELNPEAEAWNLPPDFYTQGTSGVFFGSPEANIHKPNWTYNEDEIHVGRGTRGAEGFAPGATPRAPTKQELKYAQNMNKAAKDYRTAYWDTPMLEDKTPTVEVRLMSKPEANKMLDDHWTKLQQQRTGIGEAARGNYANDLTMFAESVSGNKTKLSNIDELKNLYYLAERAMGEGSPEFERVKAAGKKFKNMLRTIGGKTKTIWSPEGNPIETSETLQKVLEENNYDISKIGDPKKRKKYRNFIKAKTEFENAINEGLYGSSKSARPISNLKGKLPKDPETEILNAWNPTLDPGTECAYGDCTQEVLDTVAEAKNAGHDLTGWKVMEGYVDVENGEPVGHTWLKGPQGQVFDPSVSMFELDEDLGGPITKYGTPENETAEEYEIRKYIEEYWGDPEDMGF